MDTTTKTKVTIETTVNAPIDKVWNYWNAPEHITKWNTPHPDWHSPLSESDLKVGGKFSTRMEAKDGSFGFDFWGIYDEIVPNKKLAYTLGDDRKVDINFTETAEGVKITETFEAEGQNSVEMQRSGWQAIIDNFKMYTEEN